MNYYSSHQKWNLSPNPGIQLPPPPPPPQLSWVKLPLSLTIPLYVHLVRLPLTILFSFPSVFFWFQTAVRLCKYEREKRSFTLDISSYILCTTNRTLRKYSVCLTINKQCNVISRSVKTFSLYFYSPPFFKQKEKKVTRSKIQFLQSE